MNSIYPELQNTLQKLCFISKIKEGQKINVNYRPTIVGNGSWLYSYYESFFRSMNGEGRESTINYLKQVIAEAIRLLENYKSHQQQIKYLINLMQEAKKGIKNLRVTYYNDIHIVSQLDILILQISQQIDNCEIKENKENNLKQEIKEDIDFSSILNLNQL
jgi:hypothetical protein